jgi:hypothetical protein
LVLFRDKSGAVIQQHSNSSPLAMELASQRIGLKEEGQAENSAFILMSESDQLKFPITFL